MQVQIIKSDLQLEMVLVVFILFYVISVQFFLAAAFLCWRLALYRSSKITREKTPARA